MAPKPSKKVEKGQASKQNKSQKQKKNLSQPNITSLEEKMIEKTEQMKQLSERKQTQLNPAKIKRVIRIVFVVLLIFIVIRGGFEIISLYKQEKQVEIELKAKIAEKEKLEKKKEYMNSEAYIEQTARDLLKMIKPGEILYVLKDNNGDALSPNTKGEDSTEDEGEGSGED